MAGEAPAISLPKGGGALCGIGETFQPDLHTGTANLNVPIPLPPGRGSLTPKLALTYSSGFGNGPFGLGWSLAVPRVSRRTDRSVPIYDDATDVFVLSGAEELAPVPLGNAAPPDLRDGAAATRYRPRTESGFARIVHVVGGGNDYWEVWSRDGLRSRYGTARPGGAADDWTDPAAIRRDDGRVFGWLLSSTADSLGNRLAYGYRGDGGAQLYLESVAYADYGDPDDPQYAVTLTVAYDDRPDPFSDRRPGFDLRTTLRGVQLNVATVGSGGGPATTVDLAYVDQTAAGPVASGVSLLAAIRVAGHDAATSESQALPPLTFSYRDWDPQARRYRALPANLPASPLRGGLELVDLFGDGLPSIVELDGVARYWRNRGDGSFDLPRTLIDAPAGASLGSPSVVLSDVDADGRAELVVGGGPAAAVWRFATTARNGGQAGFDPTPQLSTAVPSVGYADPRVRLVDLSGDRVPDLLLAGDPPWAAAGDGRGGFSDLRPLADAPPPLADPADPRVRIVDMSGDGMDDVVAIYDGAVIYWPSLGYGRFGPPVRMTDAPEFADAGADPGLGYDPARLLLADVTGDGTADAVYVDDGTVTVWVNQSGNGFAPPVTIRGTPAMNGATAVRAADLEGVGVSGVLWTGIGVRASWAFLDFTGGAKPHLMTGIDNHRGAITALTWSTSTAFAAADRSAGRPWRTTLPFPVHVVAATETRDVFSDSVLTSAFTYHEGYWDPADREFRGFGRVEQRDTLVPSRSGPAPPATQALDPLTPRTSVAADFEPSDHGNLLRNWSFDEPGGTKTTLTTTADHPASAGEAAAPGWSTWNNVPATTTTDLVPSTLPQGQGGTMLHLVTDAPGCGLVQTFLAQDTGPSRAVASLWLYLVNGTVSVGTGDGGNTGQDVTCQTTGQWVLVQAGNGRSPANELIVYAASSGGAEFYVDHAWMRVDDVPSAAGGSAPTRTASWFHLGPVGPPTGDWIDVDQAVGYWSDDPPLVPYLDLSALPDELPRGVLREALRGLRGRLLRSELYADDGDPTYGDRPYEVHESSFQVVPVLDGRGAGDPTWIDNPVVTVNEALKRTTTWDRGSEPMWRIEAAGAFDDYGRSHAAVEVGVPRGRDPRSAGEPCLAAVTKTDYATRDDTTLFCLDRIATTARHEATDDGTTPVLDFVAAALSGSADGDLRSLELSYYDGSAFTGMDVGQLGEHGLLVRTEHLVITPERLSKVSQPAVQDGTESSVPPYLPMDGAAPTDVPWPGYPSAFQDSVLQAPTELGVRLGYVWHDASDLYAAGYYAQSTRLCYDVQTPTPAKPARGVTLVVRDAYGGDTTTSWDDYDLLPAVSTDPVGLITRATYDYRIFKPVAITDANANVVAIGYTPLGLIARVARLGKEGSPEGDTNEQAGETFAYDLTAYDASAAADQRQPTSVTTVRRVEHRWTLVNQDNAARAAAGQPALTDVEIEAMFGATEEADHPERFVRTVEFSDGFGRLLQTRTQADELTVGDVGLPDDPSAATPTVTVDATGSRPRVTVNGWKVYDNKGRPAIVYEPFFDFGYAYVRPDDARLATLAANVQHYDPRGCKTITVGPDGSQTWVVHGRPDESAAPARAVPTPWETYTYDPNDNAGRTHPTLALELAAQWDTPASTVVDALGRTARTVQRGLASEVVTTYSYDIDGGLTSAIDPLGRLVAVAVHDCVGTPWLTWRLDGGAVRTYRDAAGGVAEQRTDGGAYRLGGFDAAHRPTRLWATDRTDQPSTLRQVTVYGDDRQQSGLTEEQAIAANAQGKVVVVYDEAGRLTTYDRDLDGNVLAATRQILRPDLLVSALPQQGGGQWSATAYAVDWQPGDGETLSGHADALLDPVNYRVDGTFDALGRRTTTTEPEDATGGRAALAFAYGRGGGLTSAQAEETPVVQQIAYDAHGRRTVAWLGNGILIRYRYDPSTSRLRRVRAERARRTDAGWSLDGSALQDQSLRYDANGNVLTVGDRASGCGLPAGADPAHSAGLDALDRQFAYDALNRLLSATGRETDIDPTPPWIDRPRSIDITQARPYSETYEYDMVGNMSALRHRSGGDTTASYNQTYQLGEGTNALAEMTVGALTVPYTCDARGNMLTEAANRFLEWDHANRLATFRDQAGSQTATVYAQYRYDASGERVVKVVRKSSGPGQVTVYVGDLERVLEGTIGQSMAAYDDLHLTDRGAGLCSIRRGPAAPDDPLPEQPVRYELIDRLGSVVATTDGDGAALNREEYLPYGKTAFGSYTRKRFRFTGRERDGESGLAYHRARYYAPWLGRWTACDPAADPASHPYVYADANPMRFVDPGGRTNEDGTAAAGTPGPAVTAVAPLSPAQANAALDAMTYGQVQALMKSNPRAARDLFIQANVPVPAGLSEGDIAAREFEEAFHSELNLGVTTMVMPYAGMGSTMTPVRPVRDLAVTIGFRAGMTRVFAGEGGGKAPTVPEAAAKTPAPARVSGRAANELGMLREERVAQLTGGKVVKDARGQDYTVSVPEVVDQAGRRVAGIGGRGIKLDVVGPHGEFVYVGGGAKLKNLTALRTDLTQFQRYAEYYNTQALAYFERGTPQKVIDVAQRILGASNVHVFQR